MFCLSPRKGKDYEWIDLSWFAKACPTGKQLYLLVEEEEIYNFNSYSLNKIESTHIWDLLRGFIIEAVVHLLID